MSDLHPPHIAEELNRIGEKLAAGPDPFQHAGLYAAQQALCWAAQPEAFASPFDAVTGSAAGTEYCSADTCPPASSEIHDDSSGVVARQSGG